MTPEPSVVHYRGAATIETRMSRLLIGEGFMER